MEIKQGRYRHFKGHEYEVLGIAIHSETMEEMVVYKDENNMWVRPKKMFIEEVDGKPRFEFLGKV